MTMEVRADAGGELDKLDQTDVENLSWETESSSRERLSTLPTTIFMLVNH